MKPDDFEKFWAESGLSAEVHALKWACRKAYEAGLLQGAIVAATRIQTMKYSQHGIQPSFPVDDYGAL